jgi:UTP--glucose-1-phosphate uridylyltransferase
MHLRLCAGAARSREMRAAMRPIKTAVFPVAGLGTRMLPATKSIPKEMLTIVDRPAIQFAVDEAREAGIDHFVFVTGRGKGAIEDHFDTHFELEATLRDSGKTAMLQTVNDLLGSGRASFTRQNSPLGLGHAVGCARQLIGDEPFAVLLPDMVMRSAPGCLKQMVDSYHRHGGGNHVALEQVPKQDVSRYGVVGFDRTPDGGLRLTGMVEKPKPELAPSNYIISGRYILQPAIFQHLENARAGTGGEIQLTDAMVRLMQQQPFWGMEFHGETFDVGNKLGFLRANLAYGLDDADIGSALRAELEQRMFATPESMHRSAA